LRQHHPCVAQVILLKEVVFKTVSTVAVAVFMICPSCSSFFGRDELQRVVLVHKGAQVGFQCFRTNIGRYERDEMSPSIDAVKKMASVLDTTVGYLLGESNEGKTLKDTAMLKRLNDISALPDKDKEHILYTIDGLIKSAKLQTL
jgi:transcriptional regulator with XRE-family HTH domain